MKALQRGDVVERRGKSYTIVHQTMAHADGVRRYVATAHAGRLWLANPRRRDEPHWPQHLDKCKRKAIEEDE